MFLRRKRKMPSNNGPLRGRSDVVDLHPIPAIGTVEHEQLRIIGDRTPGVDIGLADALTAARTLVADIQPLIAGDVLAAHQLSVA